MPGVELITVAEAARQLRVGEQAIWRWIREGKIPHVRLPHGHIRLDLAEVLERMKRNGE